MTILLTILHVVFCLVLIIVILIQGGRGQGLSGPSFSSGNVQSLFGTQAADFLTKATSVSAICFLITASALNILESRKNRSLLEGHRPAANQIDVEAVKKALEKVKAEGATAAQTAANSTAQTAAAVTEKAAEAGAAVTTQAQTAASAVTETANAVKAQTAEAAKN